MMLWSTLLPLLSGLLAASITALASYIIVRRQSSGRIATSEAVSLWAESQAMRKDLREEVRDLRIQLAQNREEIDRLRTRVRELENGH